MPSFLDALNDEIASAEAELGALPLYQRLLELRKLRGLYTGAAAMTVNTSAAPAKTIGRSPNAERQAMLSHIDSLLEDRVLPTPIGEIFAFLSEAGIEIPGKDPRNNLSAILSNSKRYQSHGRSGWTMLRRDSAGNESAADATPTPGTSAATFELRLTTEGTEDPASQAAHVDPWRGGGT